MMHLFQIVHATDEFFAERLVRAVQRAVGLVVI